MIKVENRLLIYELNGKETSVDNNIALDVSSHWNDNRLIILSIPSNDCIVNVTVKASDLIAAINNSTNTARF